jgi:hypothetical protein
MTTKTASMQKLAREITSHLKAMKAESRPTMANGFRARRVDYAANGYMEVATDHGHTVHLTVEDCRKWLTL